MRYTQETGEILQKKEIAPGIYDITVNLPKIAKAASVGQFVNISCGGFTLRRPISLCGFDQKLGTVRLVFEVRGEGTKCLAEYSVGDMLDVVGPLGHGFSMTDSAKKAVIVGGGIGTPPLLPVAEFYRQNAVVITGFRTASAAILQQDFAAAGAKTILCTDDGSAGYHGFTTQALEEYLDENGCDIIYTCGPRAMMKGIAKLALERGIDCQVSLEERMGCGVGVCMCCVCATKGKKGMQYSRVCLNGPVFSASEVDWDV